MNTLMNRPAPALNRLRKGTITARRVLRGLLAPAARPVVVAPQTAPDPAGLYTADELPPLADIEAAAEKFVTASEQARTADRVKRASRKILDRLPAGRYGLFQVERVENAREVADLEAIRAIFVANGLGEVPMKRTAPSLKVAFAPELAEVTL
ncbi:hypothetical protein ABIA35_005987 [Catenulispora sp. MAP12-49]|uniref:hypothetical protein n=1 Tax=Catenulispora sp. MAP12-49 TaxID=3156302 RepID=UPI003515690A